MVSGTLNNSNFYSFKSYWIFEILRLIIQISIVSNRIGYLKFWLSLKV